MISNRFAGDDIARAFHDLIKKSQEKPAPPSTEEEAVNPQDFLVSEQEAPLDSSNMLDDRIKEMESCAKDSEEEKEEEHEHHEHCGCEEVVVMTVPEVPMGFAVDAKAEQVLYGLGKIAASLRIKKENFAADVVEATALSIRKDLIKEAQQKHEVFETLTKMASRLEESGDRFAADLVQATLLRIQK